MIKSFCLAVAWVLDLIFGDPQHLPHPVVWFGKLISWGERHLNKGGHKFVKGMIFSILSVIAVFGILFSLLKIAAALSIILYVVLSVLSVFYCLAGTTLIREVRGVFKAVDSSLEEGRRQVARIVGRDTSELDAQEIRTAALETLAENLSDGVIAPLFWYLLLGVPGMMAYKMINTLDSMIGYRNERYKDFGCFAARMDDVANYIPARITAFLMILSSGKLQLFSFVKRYGRQHTSPNSGYPEAALAGILNCRFGGAHNYFGEEVFKPFIGSNNRLLVTEDMNRAISINRRAELLMIVAVILVEAVIWITL